MFDDGAGQPGAALGGAGQIGADSDAHSVQPGLAHAALPFLEPVGTAPVARSFPVATAWTCLDPRTIPPRQFLHARHYIRGVVSATIAPTSVGKSQHAITDGVDMVINARLTVWYINLEDDKIELDRRIAATLLQRGKTPTDLGERLHVNGSDDAPLIIAKAVRDITEVDTDLCTALVHEIIAKHIDVLIIDPFISAHQVSENNNNSIDMVVKALAAIARGCNCAIEVVHHARKGNGKETTMDDGRGASALTAAVRSARVLNQMTPAEAIKCGIPDGERKSYVRVSMEKSNLGKLAACPQWFRLVSYVLPNGDDIGVVEDWKWPATAEMSAIDDEEMIFNIQEIVRGNPDLSPSPLAKNNYLGLHIGNITGMEKISTQSSLVTKMNKLIKTLIDEGWLKIERRKGKGRLERSFIIVGKPVIMNTL
jgi:AAA domain